jgi:3'-5' exonuclease
MRLIDSPAPIPNKVCRIYKACFSEAPAAQYKNNLKVIERIVRDAHFCSRSLRSRTKMAKKLYLDIETLPAHEDSHAALKSICAKKELKNVKKIDFEEYLLGTSFDGAFGRILCIAYAIDNEPVQVLSAEDAGGEKGVLKNFWEIVKNISKPPYNTQYPDYGVCFIGHNVMDFDLRFIYQRSIINGVKPAYDLNFARYRSYPIFDTMKEWVKWANASVGLESLCLALGIPTPKDGIDGSEVWKFYQKGKVKEILEYCKRDVEATRAIYKKMTFQE